MPLNKELRRSYTRHWAVASTAATAVLGLMAIAALLLADAWYADDQCLVAEWKCAAGTFGVVGMVLLGPLAALSALVTLTLWGLYVARR